ncbi:hypothetical protein P2318_05430 [Myxococcaceae bacterium GXIMD 01537]
MSHPRLVLFLSDVEGNLTTLRQTLKRLGDEAGLPVPEVEWVREAESLAEAGWHVAELLPAKASSRQHGGHPMDLMEESLDLVTQAVAHDFRERVLGLFTDRASSYARVCTSGPGRPTKAIEGEYLDVMRQTAKWLEVDSAALARLLGGAARNLLAASVDFGNEPPRPGTEAALPPPEPDEDDRFVDAKLTEARVLMERYLSAVRK